MNELLGSLESIVFDFDGVFTNNKVIVFEDGREAVICDRSDGLGIARLKKTGIPLLVLSTETNSVVKARCEKLGLECAQGIGKKIDYLRKWAAKRNLSLTTMAYVGNDTNDLECMAAVGCPVAVADAYPEALAAAKIVLTSRGGEGALRELTVLIETAHLKKTRDNGGMRPSESA
jgi:N-acylneuraminate cytidylyltransferase